MKKQSLKFLVIAFAFQSILTNVFAQNVSNVPSGFNFQAVFRSNLGNVLSNKNIKVKISVVADSTGSNILYSEVHTKTTSSLGSVSLVIGHGGVLYGSFSNIQWSTGLRYLKVEFAEFGQNTYDLFSVTQLMSVPYAMHALTVEKESDPLFRLSVAASITSSDTARWNSNSTQRNIVSNPVGSIIFFASTTPPTGYLLCDGSAISRSKYPALLGVIGVTYGMGDGLNTFNLPDLRGEFIRGYDNGRGVDSSRVFGSFQKDELRSHRHEYTGGQTGLENNYWIQGRTVDFNSQPLHTDYTGGSETRPRNIALLPCIKF